jgi:hypothetical protein
VHFCDRSDGLDGRMRLDRRDTATVPDAASGGVSAAGIRA